MTRQLYLRKSLILAVDTSCDDTSAAVVEDGRRILSSVVSSQGDVHAKYGGVVPELASRRHIEVVLPVVREALKSAGLQLCDLSAVAVCMGPGLIGCLIVGVSFAKSLAYASGLPLLAVNHLEGHVFTPFVTDRTPEFPFLSLVISGGHTSIYRVDGFSRYRELGRTRDDAAGEAYDKTAKLLGLGYPGGPAIDALAAQGDPRAVTFPRAYLPDTLDFSFSGLKTSVRNFMTRGAGISTGDVCASFQAAVVDVIAKKIQWAVERQDIARVAIAGGVAANDGLRSRLTALSQELGFELFLSPRALCTDNAAMIAAAGHFHFLDGRFAGLRLNPKAYLPIGGDERLQP
jgi:N6-L-threonylcarbamoyladenine synthase